MLRHTIDANQIHSWWLPKNIKRTTPVELEIIGVKQSSEIDNIRSILSNNGNICKLILNGFNFVFQDDSKQYFCKMIQESSIKNLEITNSSYMLDLSWFASIFSIKRNTLTSISIKTIRSNSTTLYLSQKKTIVNALKTNTCLLNTEIDVIDPLIALRKNLQYGNVRSLQEYIEEQNIYNQNSNLDRELKVYLQRNKDGYKRCQNAILQMILIKKYRNSVLSNIINNDIFKIIIDIIWESRGSTQWIT